MTDKECLIRPAALDDRYFIVEAIIEAEKSGTDKFGLSTLFGLPEEEVSGYLVEMLEEEIDGCEFSISSFLIAEVNQVPVAAMAGWIEGRNEDGLSSALLKSNLLSYVFPSRSLEHIRQLSDVIRDLQISREKETYQIEYVYVSPDYRGHHLSERLLEEHCQRGCVASGTLRKIQVQVFAGNLPALRAYEKFGFVRSKEYRGYHPEITDYLPGNVKLLLEKTVK